MENKGKDVTADIAQMMSEWKLKEEAYNEMPKDKLVDRLILCEMELAAEKAESVNRMELWYFVSDETGAKYLSDKKPEMWLTARENFGDEANVTPEGFSYIMETLQPVLVTDGEINIRVPKKMETMFPEIKYGDEPIKVRISNIAL